MNRNLLSISIFMNTIPPGPGIDMLCIGRINGDGKQVATLLILRIGPVTLPENLKCGKIELVVPGPCYTPRAAYRILPEEAMEKTLVEKGPFGMIIRSSPSCRVTSPLP